MKAFFDSSALVKRYIEEQGTLQVNEILATAKEVAVCVICITEVLSACNRLRREKRISQSQYEWIKNEFFLDMNETFVINITNEIISRSVHCLECGAVRSLDALYVAAAIEYKCKLFVTADIKQQEIAGAMGLKVEII